MGDKWYIISNEQDIPSPAILVFPDRIQEKIRRMIAIAGGVGRPRPHVKTHKLPQVVQMQMEAGIIRFKCATLSEAAMLAATGVKDILVAYPLYAPAMRQLIALMEQYPEVRFSMLIDNPIQIEIAAKMPTFRGKPLIP